MVQLITKEFYLQQKFAKSFQTLKQFVKLNHYDLKSRLEEEFTLNKCEQLSKDDICIGHIFLALVCLI